MDWPNVLYSNGLPEDEIFAYDCNLQMQLLQQSLGSILASSNTVESEDDRWSSLKYGTGYTMLLDSGIYFSLKKFYNDQQYLTVFEYLFTSFL
jgi:hypothetical protein